MQGLQAYKASPRVAGVSHHLLTGGELPSSTGAGDCELLNSLLLACLGAEAGPAEEGREMCVAILSCSCSACVEEGSKKRAFGCERQAITLYLLSRQTAKEQSSFSIDPLNAIS